MLNTKYDRIFALCYIGCIICDIICSYYTVHYMLSVWHKSRSIMFYPFMLLASIREMSNSYLPEDLSKLRSDEKRQLKLSNIKIHKFVTLLVLKYFINYVIFIKLSSYYKNTQYLPYIPLIVMPILKTFSDKDLYS